MKGCFFRVVKWTLIVFGSVFVLAIIGAIISPSKPKQVAVVPTVTPIAAGPTATATSMPPTSKATSTPTITDTPLPTNTPTVTQTPSITPSPTKTHKPTDIPPPTATPTATNTPEPASTNTSEPLPTDTPLPIPTATVEEVSFESGGLGLQTADFEASHTKTGTDIMGAIYDNNLIVSFQSDRVWYIERQWGSDAPVTHEDVEVLSATLIPTDSVLVETYNPDGRPETTVNLYMSESLKSRFGEWIGGEAGNFTIQYNTYDGAVTRLIIAIGNNP